MSFLKSLRSAFNSPFIRSTFVVAAVLTLLLAYADTHLLYDSQTFLSQITGAVADVLLPLIIVVIAGGVGRLLIGRLTGATPGAAIDSDRPIYPLRLSRAERVALEATFGLGVLSMLIMVLGLIGLFSATPLRIFLVVAALAALRWSIPWLTDLVRAIRSAFSNLTVWTAFLALFCVIMLGAALLKGLAPPFTWDTLVYHLPIPTHYLSVGRIDAQPDNPFFGFAQSTEMIYGLILSIFGRDTAIAPMHWMYGMLALLAVGGFVRRYVDQDERGNGRAFGWLAIAILLSAFSVWLYFAIAYIDLVTMLFGVLTVITLTQWRFTEDNKRRIDWLILTGLCLGLAFTTKYPTAMLAIAAVVYVVWCTRHAGLISILRAILWMGVPAVIIGIGWFTKDLILYHNPIYPYVINGLNWNNWRSNFFNDSGLGYWGTPQFIDVLTLPLTGTLYGLLNRTGYAADVGIWLFMGPIILPGWGALPKALRPVAASVGLLMLTPWLLWAFFMATTGIGEQTRLMTPIFGGMAILATLGFYGVTRWTTRPFNAARFVQVIMVITFVIQIVNVVRTLDQEHTFTYLTGQMDRQTFLTDNTGDYAYAMQQLATLPANSRVLFLWEPRGYHCPTAIKCTSDAIVDNWVFPIASGQTPDQVFKNWQGRFDYILVYTDGYKFEMDQPPRHDGPFLASFGENQAKWLKSNWSGFGYDLYTWQPGSG